jgi:CRP/FNR family cyclic AMP-dependent transcriptional regulator
MEKIFPQFSQQIITYLNNKSVFKEYTPGQQIIRTGDVNSEVYFIKKGEANALNYCENGKSVNYANLKAGDFFGELTALDGLPRSATVVASTKSNLSILSGEDFNYLIDNNLDFNRLVLNRLVNIIRTGNERISDIVLLKANQRICIELLRLASVNVDDRLLIKDMPTQEVFSKTVGTSRETVIRTMKRLTELGIIKKISGRNIYINDQNKLENMALV